MQCIVRADAYNAGVVAVRSAYGFVNHYMRSSQTPHSNSSSSSSSKSNWNNASKSPLVSNSKITIDESKTSVFKSSSGNGSPAANNANVENESPQKGYLATADGHVDTAASYSRFCCKAVTPQVIQNGASLVTNHAAGYVPQSVKNWWNGS